MTIEKLNISANVDGRPSKEEFQDAGKAAMEQLNEAINKRYPFAVISLIDEDEESFQTTTTGLFTGEHCETFIQSLQKDLVELVKDATPHEMPAALENILKAIGTGLGADPVTIEKALSEANRKFKADKLSGEECQCPKCVAEREQARDTCCRKD